MQDAHCMSCRQTWSRDVLITTFPPSWVNGAYKKHRETILVEREKQLLPESQTLVYNYRMAKHYRTSVDEKGRELYRLKRKMAEMTREIWNDRHRAERYEYNDFRGVANPNAPDLKKKKAEFICPCPVNTCRGFMGPEMVCGVCDNKACVQCGVLLPMEPDDTGASGSTIPAPHVCNPDVMASFKTIKKQTKPCPKCAVPTFKISGCAQMWCTECQTTWDWNSGDIVKGVIHNPHYFAYMREKSKNGEIPRQPGDQPMDCDRQRFPSAWEVTRKLREYLEELPYDKNSQSFSIENAKTGHFSAIQRRLMHINEVEIPTLRHRYRNTDNADLRLKYLINEINEEDFKIQLQRREKKREKDVACRDIYQMACDTGRDVLWEFVMKERDFPSTLKELEEIKMYANRHLLNIRDKYKNSVNLI
jgi:hypothetical protein